jgi:hypothetical protein
MPVSPEDPRLTPADVDRDGERLLEALVSCDKEETFAARIEASLREALVLLAEDHALTRLLDVDPYLAGDMPIVQAQLSWLGRYAELLRRVASEATAAGPPPPVLEPSLIRGICWAISKRVRAGQAESLPEMLPELRTYVLSYYAPPGEPKAG